MYPHERSLVNRLKDKPFVLLGINSDSDREALKKVLEKEQITWRSWWDGGNTSGPIATKWNVHGWPTLYILDHRGIIRHKFLNPPGAEKLDAAINALVQEAAGEIERLRPALEAATFGLQPARRSVGLWLQRQAECGRHVQGERCS